MGTKVGELYVEVDAKLGNYDRQMKKAKTSLSGLGTQAKTTGTKLGSLWKKMAAGALVIGGVTMAIRGLVGFMRSSINASINQEKSLKALDAVLKSTSGAAGLTKDELVKMAAAMQKVTTYGDETVMKAQSLLLTFTSIGRDVFPDALKIVLDMSTALGQGLKESAIQVGKALQDPILGITALRRVGVNFSDDQKKVVKQLVETGKMAEAQAFILKELQTEFGGAATAARDTFGGALQSLKNVIGDAKEQIGDAVTQNESFRRIIKDVTDSIVLLIESGDLGAWAEGVVEKIQTVIYVFKNFKDGLDAMSDPLKAASGGLVTVGMNAAGVESPLQTINRLMAEGKREVIDFKNSLKVLNPSVEDLRKEIERGPEHWEAYKKKLKATDDELAKSKGLVSDSRKKLFEMKNILKDIKPEQEKFAHAVKVTREETETAVPKIKGISASFDHWGGSIITVTKLIEKMKDGLTSAVYQEMVPAARDMSDVLDKAVDNMIDSTEDYRTAHEKKIKTDSNSVKKIWDDVSERIKDKWTTELGQMLAGAKSWKDGLSSIWSTIKQQFFDLVAQMITRWTLGLVKNLLEGGKSLFDGLKGVFGGIGKIFSGTEDGSGSGGLAGNMAGSFLSSIGSIAGPIGIGLLISKFVDLKAVGAAVTDALKTAIGAVGDVISSVGKLVSSVFGAGESIISGIGSALGAVGGVIGKLANLISAGGKKYGEITYWLKLMKDIEQQILNWTGGSIVPILDDIKHSGWTRQAILNDIKYSGWTREKILIDIRDNTWNTWRTLKDKMGSAQAGMHKVATSPGIVAYHPGEQIDITPLNVPLTTPQSAQPTGISSSGRSMSVQNTFYISALDGADVERVVTRKILPILDKAYRDNIGGATRKLSVEVRKY